MKQYHYKGTHRSQVAGVMAMILSVVYVAVAVTRNIPDLERGGDPLTWLFSGLLMALILAAGWFIGLYFVNLLPTVWTTDDYLVISTFRHKQIRIRWQDIVDVRELPSPSVYYPPDSILIRARHISIFHHVYGIICARSLLPAFVVHKEIVGYEELLSEIQRRVNQAYGSLPDNQLT